MSPMKSPRTLQVRVQVPPRAGEIVDLTSEMPKLLPSLADCLIVRFWVPFATLLKLQTIKRESNQAAYLCHWPAQVSCKMVSRGKLKTSTFGISGNGCDKCIGAHEAVDRRRIFQHHKIKELRTVSSRYAVVGITCWYKHRTIRVEIGV